MQRVIKNKSYLVHVDDLLHDVIHKLIRRLDTRVDGWVTEELAGHVDGLIIHVWEQVRHARLLYFFYINTIHLLTNQTSSTPESSLN